jgi:hypothetical protein
VKATRQLTTLRATRGLAHSASHSLDQAEAVWLRFVTAVELLASVHGDAEVGGRARDIAQQMHAFREVLRSWTEE